MNVYNHQIDDTVRLLQKPDLTDNERAHHARSFAFLLKQAKALQDQARYNRQGQTAANNYDFLIAAEQERVDTLQALLQIPDQLEGLWTENLPYRNTVTLLRNPVLND